MANRFFPNYNTYKITSPYGMRTVNGVASMHDGIDLVARTDGGASAVDYITAHTGGIVDGVGYDVSAGYFVRIKVADGVLMYYFHLREISSLKKGDAVRQGEVIGYMGSTGNSTGAHLHWGIKVNGAWIDPTPYLDKDYPVKENAEYTFSVTLRALKQGDTGEDVKALQALLVGYGYSMGGYGADGSFGPATDAALRAYQQAKGLAADGSAGPATMTALLGR